MLQFKPRLIPALATMIVLPILLSLGFWQCDRADQKRTMQADYRQQQHKTPKAITEITNPKNYQRASIKGHFDNEHTFLLDNQFHNHQAGYHVITPVNTEDKVILINRGWIPRGKNRNQLPTINPIKKAINLTGHIYTPNKKSLVLKNTLETTWPRRIQKIDINTIEQALEKPIYPFIIRLEPNQPHGFKRDWKIINMPPEKHIAYAVQWFSLAAVVIILFLALNTHKTVGAKNTAMNE